jgi:DNA-binding transcriptional regulator YdaS (Cro superfamily)
MTTKLSPERVALLQAAESLGGQAALASALGYNDRRNVAPYFAGGRRIPAEHCPALERATRRKHAEDPSKRIVTCEELRPDVAWDVLRLQTAPDHQAAA